MCGLSAVTSMSDDSISWVIRLRLAVIPETHDFAKQREASPSSRADESRLATITGLKTLSSKWPWQPPKVIAAWLPTTCAHTIASPRTASGSPSPA